MRQSDALVERLPHGSSGEERPPSPCINVCALGAQGGDQVTELFRNDMTNALKFLSAPNLDTLTNAVFGPVTQEKSE